jgi:anti-anti-sigma factor
MNLSQESHRLIDAVLRNGRTMPLNDPYFSLQIDYATRVIDVIGEFDLATAASLATAITRVQCAGPGDITINLYRVTFIDAAGLGSIVTARNAQTSRGDDLIVTGGAGRVRRIFDLLDQTRLLQAAGRR